MRLRRRRFRRRSRRSSACTDFANDSPSSWASTKRSSHARHHRHGMTRRKVLVVSYTFPPQYDVSARRAAKLCKYLPGVGWDPVVLTKDWAHDVSPEDERVYAIVSHPAALDEIPAVPVVRAAYRTHDNPLRRLHKRLAVASSRRWSPRALTRRTLSLISPTFGDFPDAFRGWIPGAVNRGVELVERECIDAIYSLCPPA